MLCPGLVFVAGRRFPAFDWRRCSQAQRGNMTFSRTTAVALGFCHLPLNKFAVYPFLVPLYGHAVRGRACSVCRHAVTFTVLWEEGREGFILFY